MDEIKTNKVEVIYCPPGYAEGYAPFRGYDEDIEWHKLLRGEVTSSYTAIESHTRLWIAAIKECLDDLQRKATTPTQKLTKSESFHWLFRDKITFPIVAGWLGCETVELRKKIIKFAKERKYDKSLTTINTKEDKLMQDLDKMPWPELKQLAKDKGINTQGMKRPDVEAAIKSNAILELSKVKAAPESPPATKLITDINEVKASAPAFLKSSIENAEIIDACNAIFKVSLYPKARAILSEEADGIEFLGGPKKHQWVTLQQPHKTIKFFAKAFVGRVTVEKVVKDESGNDVYTSVIS